MKRHQKSTSRLDFVSFHLFRFLLLFFLSVDNAAQRPDHGRATEEAPFDRDYFPEIPLRIGQPHLDTSVWLFRVQRNCYGQYDAPHARSD